MAQTCDAVFVVLLEAVDALTLAALQAGVEDASMEESRARLAEYLAAPLVSLTVAERDREELMAALGVSR